MRKMLNFYQTVVIALILQHVNAAPSELLQKIENVAKTDPTHEKLNTLLEEGDKQGNATVQGQRQKRYYNNFAYGFPFSPPLYPGYPSNDYGYSQEDPFGNIYRRLQDIVTVIRQPANVPPRQLPPPFPIYFPVVYIPSVGCGCTPDQTPPKTPDANVPTTLRPDKNDTSDLDISNRFPEMEDDRQNWGLVVNDTDLDDGLPDDFTRPISFEPIRPVGKPRPPPPVEHGSSQAGEGGIAATTFRPPPPPANQGRPAAAAPPRPDSPPPPPPPQRPSPCDAAVISCCHQAQVTYDCFAALGCPDPSSFGNPCDNQVILGVIDRYQRFYGQRSG